MDFRNESYSEGPAPTRSSVSRWSTAPFFKRRESTQPIHNRQRKGMKTKILVCRSTLDMEDLVTEMTALNTQVLTLTGIANKPNLTNRPHLPRGEAGDSQKGVEKECGSKSCSTKFQGKTWMGLCKECFGIAKTTRQPVQLTTGQKLSNIDRPAQPGKTNKPGIIGDDFHKNRSFLR